MKEYDIFVFILCFIVFAIFTALFSYVIALITQMRVKLIKHGLVDEEIKIEEQKKANTSRFATISTSVVSLILCLAFFVAFLFSMYINITESKAANGIPSLKVVMSSSMATVNERNTYITQNGLTDQFQTFDVVVTRRLPEENELKLYDIVVYQKDDAYVIHRIVGIEEPNEKHPNCRYFTLQGDAVAIPDKAPVLYSQMRGIYEGERIPFAGSFIVFMQSPAGWLCFILVLFAVIATPILDKKFDKEAKERLRVIGCANVEDNKEISKKKHPKKKRRKKKRWKKKRPKKKYLKNVKNKGGDLHD